MKKQILTLMLSATVFAMNPAFGMEGDEAFENTTHQGIVKKDPPAFITPEGMIMIFQDLPWGEDESAPLSARLSRLVASTTASMFMIPIPPSTLMMDSYPRNSSSLTRKPAFRMEVAEELVQESGGWRSASDSAGVKENDQAPTWFDPDDID